MTNRGTLAVSFIVFVAMGMLGAALGPALPDLADRAGSTLATLGALFTASFGGTMVAQMLAGPLNDRLGQRPVLLVGLGVAALGALDIVLSRSLWLTLGGGVIFGLGFGALDVSTNVLIAETFADRSVPVLNLLHVFYGVGSVLGPAAVSVGLRLWDSSLPALGVGIALLAVPVPFVLRLAPGPVPARANTPAPDVPDSFTYRAPLLWALGALLLLYVGVEAGMGAWTTAYVDRSTTLSVETAALITSGFWLALTVGRVAGAAWGGRFTPYTVLWGCLAGMLAGGVLLALGTGSALLTILAVLMIGFWAGPPFPTIVAIATVTFRSGPGKAAGTVVALGSLGAATLPWTQGVVLDRAGPAANAIYIVTLTGVMVLLYVGIRRRATRQAY
jgi:FHS family Na+ dependent glucose MFS transporter 1